MFYQYDELMDILGKVYSDYQGNDTEKLIVITDDGQPMIFESGEKHRVSLPFRDILTSLARRGKHLGQVTTMIHNHNRGQDISSDDVAVFKKLRAVGYKGSYQVYYPEKRRLKAVKITEEKTMDKHQAVSPGGDHGAR